MPNLVLTSPAFKSGEVIPKKYTCQGQDVSPPLSISGIPDGTASLVLIVDDPDAPGKTFVHWVVFNLPEDTSDLAEGVDIEDRLGAVQGVNDFRKVKYGGPCPPPGSPHHYHFRLYALDSTLDLEAGASKKQVTNAMEGAVLDEVDLIGLFQRG